MNRAMVLTLLAMVASVAAAVAAPEVDATSRVACLEAATATGAAKALPASAPVAVRPPSATQTSAPNCTTDATEPYRRWHHGSRKLAPACTPTAWAAAAI